MTLSSCKEKKSHTKHFNSIESKIDSFNLVSTYSVVCPYMYQYVQILILPLLKKVSTMKNNHSFKSF